MPKKRRRNRPRMSRRIQSELTESGVYEMEKAKEKMGVKSDYAFVRLAISELCKRCLNEKEET